MDDRVFSLLIIVLLCLCVWVFTAIKFVQQIPLKLGLLLVMAEPLVL